MTQTTATETKLLAWLADPANYAMEPHPWPLGGRHRGFTESAIRKALHCADGTTVSVQHSAGHYSYAQGFGEEPSFEMWFCPHHPISEPYGGGEDPYAYVPMHVLVAYLDFHGGIAK